MFLRTMLSESRDLATQRAHPNRFYEDGDLTLEMDEVQFRVHSGE